MSICPGPILPDGRTGSALRSIARMDMALACSRILIAHIADVSCETFGRAMAGIEPAIT